MPAQSSTKLAGATFSVTELALASSKAVDLNGEAAGLIIDADADTSISAPTDDQIDFEISGADDFRMLANIFRAMSGSVIETNTINETTGGSGITIDGALVKDGRSNLGREVQALTASGAISIKSGLVTLAHATVVIAATLAAPVAGDELFIVDSSASGTAAHTVTLTAATFHGGASTIATLNAPGEALHLIALSSSVWFVLENIGSVALS